MFNFEVILLMLSFAVQSLCFPWGPPSGSTTAARTLSGTGTGPPRSGDGSGTNWPSANDWISFDSMWELNEAAINSECTGDVPNSALETASIKNATLSAALTYNVDNRFILAVMMQESHGCARVKSTAVAHPNQGLLQDHDGDYNCIGVPANQCSVTQINGMINDGTGGTLNKATGGSGLQQLLAKASSLGGTSASQNVYIAARLYNSGDWSYQTGGDLSKASYSIPTYSQDIANRMMGYVF